MEMDFGQFFATLFLAESFGQMLRIIEDLAPGPTAERGKARDRI
jgi:hypothetical protein